MRIKWMFAAVVLGAILIFAKPVHGEVAGPPANGVNSTSPAYNPWAIELVDSGGIRKFMDNDGVSIVFDEDTGHPLVSYYDGIDWDLRLAARSGSDSHCVPTSKWSCETIDAEGEVGQNSSLATFSSPALTKYGIAYHDETNLTVKVAIQTCMPLFGCMPWEISTIDELRVRTQAQPSLVFDSHGTPRLVYQQKDNVFDQDNIVYAWYVGSGGNCGMGDASGEWECDHDSDAHSQYGNIDISLALTSNDDPVVAYLDHEDSGHTLRLCWIHPDAVWDCQTIDDISNKSAYVSLVLDQDDHPRIAYSTDGVGGVLDLRYARYVGSGGNCGTSGNYQCDTIFEDIGSYDGPLAMTLDESALPVIAYTANGSVMVARPTIAYNTLLGNCGPIGIGWVYSWKCMTVANPLDDGQSLNAEIGVAVDRSGATAIAYSVSDSSNSYLMVARQYWPVYLPLVIH